MYDVIVVGATTAGTSIAMLLAGWGQRVLVVDQPGGRELDDGLPVLSPVALALLARSALLEPLLSTGCPMAPSLIVAAGSTTVELGLRNATPRRDILEGHLVDAARRAGAEVRNGFTVRDVVWRDGAVCGVVGSGPDQHTVCEEAPLVIGADGRRSVVARAVAAPLLRERAATTCCYYAYWRDIDVVVPEIHLGEAVSVVMLPQHEGVVGVLVARDIEDWARYKRAPEVTYEASLHSVSTLSRRFGRATRLSRFYGTADLGACVRRAAGPGWVLVGHAGRHAGGVGPWAIGHVLVQAELLARALGERMSVGSALSTFEAASENLLTGVEDVTTDLMCSCPSPDELAGLVSTWEEGCLAQERWADTFHSMGAAGSGAYDT